jgi:large subunit ribosomal protein L13
MLPRGPLGRAQLRNLKIYASAEHPHSAQMPAVLNLSS